MKSTLIAAICAVCLPLNAAAVQFYTFYADCDLGVIDTRTDTSTPLGSLGNWSVEAMDYGPDGLLYATVELGCGVHGNANTLAVIDPDSLTVLPIGPIGFFDVDALAFSPAGELFGVAMGSYELITIDPSTGAGTAVGPLGLPQDLGRFMGAIEFLLDGTLVGIDMEDASGGPSWYWRIDTVTGNATPVGFTGFDSVEGMSLGTGPFQSLFALAYAMEADRPALLIRLNQASGEGIFVQEVPLPPGYEGQRDALVALPAREILIDIKPGSWPNTVNLRKGGVIPVAVLSTYDLDATVVDDRRARFGPAGAAIVHESGHYEDVDGDGMVDLLLHFDATTTGIGCGDESAELRSVDGAGLAIVGTDLIKTVGCN